MGLESEEIHPASDGQKPSREAYLELSQNLLGSLRAVLRQTNEK
jgi:hypothetical protein